LSAIDIQVLENGAMRGHLQDQWNEDAGCPAERPFVFMTIISNGDVFDCGFLKDKNGDLDNKRIWNGATISFHPNQFLSDALPLSRLPGLRNVSLPQVRSLEIRPLDEEDIIDPYGHESPDINSSEDEPLDSDNEKDKAQIPDEGTRNLVGSTDEEGTHRLIGYRPPVEERESTMTYGFRLTDPHLDDFRRTFETECSVAGGNGFVAKRLEKIILDVRDQLADDPHSKKRDLDDEITRQVILYLNQCFAFVISEGKSSHYVYKTKNPGDEHPLFLSKDEKAVKELINMATTKIIWPPASRRSVGKEKKSKEIVVSPFNLWRRNAHALVYEKIVREPSKTDTSYLNIWYPNAMTPEMVNGWRYHKYIDESDGR